MAVTVTVSPFGKDAEGREVQLYTLSNGNGVEASVANIGAALVRLMAPDKRGDFADVVLGFDSAEGYLENGCFFGVAIGPNANRIGKASFTLDGTVYHLKANDGENNLHSDRDLGWHKRFWEASVEGDSVVFRLEEEPDSMGFPGRRKAEITYSLSEKNELSIRYHASSDRRTVLNPTNHTYFNLKGHGNGTILGHMLRLEASRYTPVDACSIPTGEIAEAGCSPMDFGGFASIGWRIDGNFGQLKSAGGYDHNWVINGWDGTLRRFAILKEPFSGRVLEAYTTLPGVQFYTGNYITEQAGKAGAVYRRRSGLCLETQYFPDSVNRPEFPSCIFGEGRDYESVTVYCFKRDVG